MDENFFFKIGRISQGSKCMVVGGVGVGGKGEVRVVFPLCRLGLGVYRRKCPGSCFFVST